MPEWASAGERQCRRACNDDGGDLPSSPHYLADEKVSQIKGVGQRLSLSDRYALLLELLSDDGTAPVILASSGIHNHVMNSWCHLYGRSEPSPPLPHTQST